MLAPSFRGCSCKGYEESRSGKVRGTRNNCSLGIQCKGRGGANSFSRGSPEAPGVLLRGACVRGARSQAGGRFEVPGILLPRGSCMGYEGSSSRKVRGTRNISSRGSSVRGARNQARGRPEVFVTLALVRIQIDPWARSYLVS